MVTIFIEIRYIKIISNIFNLYLILIYTFYFDFILYKIFFNLFRSINGKK